MTMIKAKMTTAAAVFAGPAIARHAQAPKAPASTRGFTKLRTAVSSAILGGDLKTRFHHLPASQAMKQSGRFGGDMRGIMCGGGDIATQ
jgi:hypothetical protein